jgi:hypothetical protein
MDVQGADDKAWHAVHRALDGRFHSGIILGLNGVIIAIASLLFGLWSSSRRRGGAFARWHW